MNGFRGRALSWGRCWRTVPVLPSFFSCRWASTDGPSAASPSQRWRQEPTWEEVGGSQSKGWKPDIAMETGLVVAIVCSGPYCNSSSAGCGLSQCSLGWSMVSLPHFPKLFLGVSGQPVGKGWLQKSCFRNSGIQTKDRQGETCFSSQIQTSKQTNRTSMQSLFPQEPGEMSCWSRSCVRISLQAEKEEVISIQAEASTPAVRMGVSCSTLKATGNPSLGVAPGILDERRKPHHRPASTSSWSKRWQWQW